MTRLPVRCRRAASFWAMTLTLAGGLISGPVSGSEPALIVRIEEDWELVINTPEPVSNSPQITCAMSPTADHDGLHVTFELNHQSQPGYATGGLHLHAWDGSYLLASAHTQPEVYLNQTEETVTWTQRMTVESGELIYEVVQGNSVTWAAFGESELVLRVPTNLTDLNGYSVDTTLAGSGVGFGSNRVSSLVLKRIRLYTATDLAVVIELDQNLVTDETNE